MPDNWCVPMCCKTGYHVDADVRKVTYQCLSIEDPSKLKLTFATFYNYCGFSKEILILYSLYLNTYNTLCL